MPFASGLLGLGLRQAIDSAIDRVALAVQRHLTDHAETLPRALCRANDRTWRALAVALAGDRLFGRVRALLAGGDVRGVREQVRFFLQTCAPEFEKEPEAYRRTCLAELNDARRAGLLSAEGVTPAELAEQAARFPRFSEAPQTALAEAQAAVACLTDELAPRCRHLADLIGRPTPGGVPLVLAVFVFFFRREVETDPELARGLNFEALRRLTAAQEAGLARIDGALEGMGRQVDQALASLAAMQDEIRALFREVCERLDRAEMREPEVRPWHSLSIRGDAEKQAVRALLARFRELPPEEQQHLPGLLNGLGKLQIGTGDFHGAWESFEKAATAAPDAAARAQAHHNAYRAALEERNWSEALAAILRAVELDPRRFTPFPLHRYRPERILGAGGFGTVFLCHDRNFDEPVVVKSLHAADLERDMAEVFREARVLRRLSHESIIGVRDCEYADPAAAARPFVVMDYFPGLSLEVLVRERGALPPGDVLSVARQVAAGMRAAHEQGVLHRDLKPDNVLVRQGPDGRPEVRVIDFGLAMRRQTIETSRAARPAGETILGESVAGTLKYAPPEQMGELRGVPPGPYSDVYSFGKLCCYALFRTTEPKSRHWDGLARSWGKLRHLLEHCTEEEVGHRPRDFAEVLGVLDDLSSGAGTKSLPARAEAVGKKFLDRIRSVRAGGTPAAASEPSHPAAPPKAGPGTAGAVAARQNLRASLLRDKANADLRRRYLASRTPKQVTSDRRKGAALGTVAGAVAGLLGAGVAVATLYGILGRDFDELPGIAAVGAMVGALAGALLLALGRWREGPPEPDEWLRTALVTGGLGLLTAILAMTAPAPPAWGVVGFVAGAILGWAGGSGTRDPSRPSGLRRVGLYGGLGLFLGGWLGLVSQSAEDPAVGVLMGVPGFGVLLVLADWRFGSGLFGDRLAGPLAAAAVLGASFGGLAAVRQGEEFAIFLPVPLGAVLGAVVVGRAAAQKAATFGPLALSEALRPDEQVRSRFLP